jgi:hypothetical protein
MDRYRIIQKLILSGMLTLIVMASPLLVSAKGGSVEQALSTENVTSGSEMPNDLDWPAMAAKIVDEINGMGWYESGEIPRYATVEDVDWGKVTQWYTGCDILSLNTSNTEEILGELKSSGSGYEVPVEIDGTTCVTTLEKGSPLREGAAMF